MDKIEPQLCACGCGKPLPKPRYLHGHRTRRLSYQVEDRGYETPCWIAEGHRSSNGYVRRNRSVDGVTQQIGAHVEAHLLHIGPIPAGWHVDHLCGQRDCIRWDGHLEAVPPAINARRAHAKLTEDAVRRIRRMPRGQTPLADLASEYGVGIDTIRQIRSNRTLWRGVE